MTLAFLFSGVFGSNALAQTPTSSFAATSPQAPDILSLRHPEHRSQIVRGVVCDNGKFVLPEKFSYVVIPLRLDVEMPCEDEVRLTEAATGLDVAAMGQPGDNQLGWVQLDAREHELRYYPPFEFNVQQERDEQGNLALSLVPQRSVAVLVRSRTTAKKPYWGVADVLLARPIVVLVHGINNTASIWDGEEGTIGMGRSLDRWQFTTLAVEHGYSDFGRKEGSLYFEGNGPVEWAATRLDETIQVALKRCAAAGMIAHRVDIVAHSYGGVVARWYIKTHSLPPAGEIPPVTMQSYINSSNRSGNKKNYKIYEPLYDGKIATFVPGAYHCVRKLITIASPWRGVPVANLVNEVRAGSGQPGDLENVRLGINRFRVLKLGKFIDNLSVIATKVPSIEVLAVESQWLRALDAYPFRSDIAYEAIAGTDNAYIGEPLPKSLPYSRVDLYSALRLALPPKVLPFLDKERIVKRRVNLTDGLVPIWSAVIEPSSHLVLGSHNALLWNDAAKTYVAESLSDAGLSGGDKLNAMWSCGWSFTLPLPAEGNQLPGQQIWNFAPYVWKDTAKPPAMAPIGRSGDYEQRDGLARFSATALCTQPVSSQSVAPPLDSGLRPFVPVSP